MYGQIHLCVRSLVIKKFGEENWRKILEQSGLDEINDFMTFHYYSDELVLKLITTGAEVLGVPVTTVLEVFGDYFLTYCMECGYDKMLLTLGDSIFTFIQNLDSLHALLAMSYKQIDAPSFRCEMEDEETMILHYYSSRKGLYPIVRGLVFAIARDFFDEEVTCDVLDVNRENITDTIEQDHAIFRVVSSKSKKKKQAAEANTPIVDPKNSPVTAKIFCELFPYHIVCDENLQIKHCGVKIQKMFDKNLMDYKLDDITTILSPKITLSFESILKFINANYVLEVSDISGINKDAETSQVLAIKGQIAYLPELKHLMFIGSPRLTSLNEMQEKGLFLSDIPLYDVTRELVLLNQQREAEIEISKKLDETTAALKVTSQALEHEKAKTEMLLYQMLPMKVADSLKEGKTVNAEKFEVCTILFSDIVTFTTIAAVVQPIQIVSLLNSLYLIFDTLTNKYDVYKVETIGDAYMVVGGLPERSSIHAECVACFAIDMVEQAQEIMSPATGKPIQIRVGIHSGPVVAGVVGKKMPRYCLFGDTVNTASRMESHGIPLRVHCSPFTYDILQHNTDFTFEDRGDLEVKGKGVMRTCFLLTAEREKYIADKQAVAPPPPPKPEITEQKTTKTAAKSKTCVVL